MKTPESFEKKLYIPRNVEGKSNKEVLDIIRDLEKEFAKNQTFIGISPFGSTMKGYSQEESDIDIRVLLDSSIDPRKDSYREVNNLAYEKKLEYSAKGKELHLILVDINQYLIMDDFDRIDDNLRSTDGIISVVATLSGKVTGKKVFHYRKLVRKSILSLSSKKRSSFMERLFNLLSQTEVYFGMDKLVSRTPGAKENKREITEARIKLWKNRLEKLWCPW